MAEPDPIPSLFTLSLTALIDHVKNKKVKVSPDQIPINIHQYLWNKSTVLDLIINTCHPETRHWFATRVIKPPVLTVDFQGHRFHGNCLINISFENRETISWDLVPPNWPELHSPKFIIRTGNQYLSTQMNNDDEVFTSRLNHYNRSRFEVMNWICKAFRCEISELVLSYGVDDQLLKWPKLKIASTLNIHESRKLEDLKKLIMERQRNNLRTTIDAVHITTLVGKKLLAFIDFKTVYFNFVNLKIDQLIEEFRELSQLTQCIVVARTTDLSTEDVELFRAQLGFSNPSTTVDYERTIMRGNVLVVSELKDANLTKFRFIEKKTGIYIVIMMTVVSNSLK